MSDIDSQLLEVEVHLLAGLGKLGFEIADFVLHGLEIDLRLRLEGIDVAGNVQVETVALDLLEGRLVGVAVALGSSPVGIDDLDDVLLAQAVLFLARFEIAAGVDEQDVAFMRAQAIRLTRAVEDHDADRNARGRKQLPRQSDNRVENVVADQLFANLPFGARAKENAVRRDNRHAARHRPRDRQHVKDESVVAATLGRHVRREALVRVGLLLVLPPLVEAEGRVRDHDVELHQVIALDQRRRVQRVAPIDAGVVLIVEQHVQPREGARAAVRFLAEQLEIVVGNFLARAQQERARTAGGIADAVARFRVGELGDDLGHLARSEELACLLARVGGEALDEENVGVAKDVFGRFPEIEAGLGEILEKGLEPTVAVLGLAEVRFRIEVDGAEKAAELALVGFFNRVERHVDQLADVLAACGVRRGCRSPRETRLPRFCHRRSCAAARSES